MEISRVVSYFSPLKINTHYLHILLLLFPTSVKRQWKKISIKLTFIIFVILKIQFMKWIYRKQTKKKPYWILKEKAFIFSQIEPFLLLQMFPLKYMKKNLRMY